MCAGLHEIHLTVVVSRRLWWLVRGQELGVAEGRLMLFCRWCAMDVDVQQLASSVELQCS